MSGIVLIVIANISPLLLELRRETSHAGSGESRDLTLLVPQASSAVLLRGRDVRAELKLDDRQRAEIDRRFVDLDQSIVATSGLLNGPEGLDRMHQLVRAKKFITLSTFDRRLAEILNSVQLNRLRQIEMQTEGLHSFLRPAVLSDLKLSGKQLSAIEDLPVGAFGRFASTDDREFGLDVLRDILTDAQFQTWMNLRGPEFSFADKSDINKGAEIMLRAVAPTASSQSTGHSTLSGDPTL